LGAWVGPDYRKDFSASFVFEIIKTFSSDNQMINFFRFNTTYRFSDKFTLRSSSTLRHQRLFGYVNDETINNTAIVYFGRRKNLIFNNTISADYILNSKMYFSLRGRHYFSDVKYRQFYTLNNDGSLAESVTTKTMIRYIMLLILIQTLPGVLLQVAIFLLFGKIA